MKNINTLYTIIGALIILILIVVVLASSGVCKELFSSGKRLEYYSLSTCPHCVDFNPVWKQFEEKCGSSCKKYVVDEDPEGRKNATKYGISGYPTIVVVDNGKVIDEPEDRTCGALRETCKKHGIPCTVVC